MLVGIGLVLNILNGCHLQLSQGYSSENRSKIEIGRKREEEKESSIAPHAAPSLAAIT